MSKINWSKEISINIDSFNMIFIVRETYDRNNKLIWTFRPKGSYVLIIDHRDKSFGFSYTKRRAWERIRFIAGEIHKRELEYLNKNK